jgi:hypothetical protein
VDEVGEVVGGDLRPALPNGGVCAGPFDGGIGDVDAAIRLDIRIAKGVRCQPCVATTEIDDSQRCRPFLCPVSKRGNELCVLHVIRLNHGVVHGPLFEGFFDAGEGGAGHDEVVERESRNTGTR